MILAKAKQPLIFKTTIAALLIMGASFLYVPYAYASPLSSRSVAIGTSEPSAVTTNNFKFNYPGYDSIGSVEFEYCTNTPFAGTDCDKPVGLSVADAVITDQTGETGFTIDNSLTTVNKIVLKRGLASTNAQPSTYNFSNIINPSDANQPVFVRISTFESEDVTGGRTDEGAVVFSTARGVSVTGYVPPYLTFCVGVTVEIDCSSSAGNKMDFGELIANGSRALTSQYSGASNDPGGFSTYVTGTTMTSGNNIIPAAATPQTSRQGVSQFGMNLRANSTPGVGADPVGPGNSAPVSQFGNPNRFFFAQQLVSNSPISTDFKRFTASYVVNVSGSQPPGVYATTLTYIAVAAF